MSNREETIRPNEVEGNFEDGNTRRQQGCNITKTKQIGQRNGVYERICPNKAAQVLLEFKDVWEFFC